MGAVRDVVNRRQAATLIGGAMASLGLFRPDRTAAGATIGLGTASRLQPLGDDVYEAPTNLAAVADIYSRMTVPIGVAAAGRFAFVVDAGANQSVISEELVTRLGLKVESIEPLNGVAGLQMAPTTITDLVVGDRVEPAVVMSILPAKRPSAATVCWVSTGSKDGN